jgi:hypothetical protein
MAAIGRKLYQSFHSNIYFKGKTLLPVNRLICPLHRLLTSDYRLFVAFCAGKWFAGSYNKANTPITQK